MTAATALLLVLMQLASADAAASGAATTANADLDRRVMALARELRCLVCQNETLADSQADLAVDLRRQIREQMAAGSSEAEITAYLTDRYGDFVRYRPALKPSTYLLWFGPFLLLAIGSAMLYRQVKGRRTGPARAPLSAKDRIRAKRLLEARR